MTSQRAKAYLCVILEALSEAPQGIPSGHLYAGMMNVLTLDAYEALISIAADSGFLNVARSHLVTLTQKGQELATKIKKVNARETP
jgi:hypothetical protein